MEFETLFVARRNIFQYWINISHYVSIKMDRRSNFLEV
jgi:hypothetical protein